MKLTLISAILLVILILYDFSITQPQVQNTTSYENIQFSSNIMCYMQQHIVFKHMYLNSPKRINKNHLLYIFALLLLNSSDCHPNPIVSLGATEALRNKGAHQKARRTNRPAVWKLQEETRRACKSSNNSYINLAMIRRTRSCTHLLRTRSQMGQEFPHFAQMELFILHRKKSRYSQ